MNLFDFKRVTISVTAVVPRMTFTGKNLHTSDDASTFANAFMRRYKHKGVINLAVYKKDQDHAELHLTLQAYYPDKGNPTEAHWFHEMNLDQTMKMFHREFPYLDKLQDV